VKILAALLFLFLAARSWATGASTNASKVIRAFHLDELHESAPDFTFTDAKGVKSQLKDYRGKAILLHFWASWCTSCRKELPDLSRLGSELDSNKWVFLPISVDKPAEQEQALALLKDLGLEAQFRTIQELNSVEKYLTWGLPVTYLISPQGEIIARALGDRAWTANSSAVRELGALFTDDSAKTDK
jgi:thiol-disulfide isomerase/thioredoxin